MSSAVRILIATGNAGKVREIAAILSPLNVELLRIDDVVEMAGKGLGPVPDVMENAPTFQGNAAIKAKAFAAWSGLPSLADDSGLEVDALDGAPGVYSARYAGPEATDAANNAKLIAELKRFPDRSRTARFRCAVALAAGDRVLGEADGRIEGEIIDRPKGENGFGYDPHFYVPEYGCTTAEMVPEQKNELSHRGQAFRTMLGVIEGLIAQERLG